MSAPVRAWPEIGSCRLRLNGSVRLAAAARIRQSWGSNVPKAEVRSPWRGTARQRLRSTAASPAELNCCECVQAAPFESWGIAVVGSMLVKTLNVALHVMSRVDRSTLGSRNVLFESYVRSFWVYCFRDAALAAGKFFGPYYINLISPETVSLQSDKDNQMLAANNLPRLYLNVKVQQIKKGDIVRMVYPNGDIYDFETTIQCAYAASNSCTYDPNPVKKASITDPAKPSKYAKRTASGDLSTACETYDALRSFNTGYWRVTWPDTGTFDIVRTEAEWVDTGIQQAYIEIAKGKQPFCK
jgi:hypothetical protein